MTVAAGLLFFMAAALTESFRRLVLVMNDREIAKTFADWGLFIALAVPTGCLWACVWLLFKGCEKKFLEVWFSKPGH